MLKFNYEEYVKTCHEVVNLFSNIEKVVDEVYNKGFQNIFFISSGGSVAEMLPLERLFKNHSTIPVFLENAGDIVLTGNKHLTKESIVLMASKSGDTKETVAAAKYCKTIGSTIVSLVGVQGSPLASLSDYVIDNHSKYMEHTFINMYVFAHRMLFNNGEYPEYTKFIEHIKKAAIKLVDSFEKFEPVAAKIAKDHYKDDYQIWVGSGTMWGVVYLYAMCILEEMQWIRTKSVTSADFFHGTLELVDETVPVFLIKTMDETRPLDNRVEKFINQFTEKGVIIDPKDYLPAEINEEIASRISPIVMAAILKRLSYHFESRTGHSLEFRRYYRQFAY
ncbi:SIS domain-containing protein [Caldifermentibacillus hisashii]|uniref:SIS domain-containing protein n=1 Tax=Caldifermentibacillus hisashii TaxID=996558 RepID=UPI002E07E28B|nr:SIS domain-containing protein [Caldifermentibacillus hisashii]